MIDAHAAMLAWITAFGEAVINGRPVSLFDHPNMPGRYTLNPLNQVIDKLTPTAKMRNASFYEWIRWTHG